MNITVIDNAMTIFFKKKISVIHYFFMFRIVLISLSPISGIRGYNQSNFSESCDVLHFVTALSPTNNNFGTRKKSLKKQRHLKRIFSMHYRKHVFLYIFCEILVLTPSFFGAPYKSYYTITAIKVCLVAYILLYKKTKIFTRQIRNLISSFLCPNISSFL